MSGARGSERPLDLSGELPRVPVPVPGCERCAEEMRRFRLAWGYGPGASRRTDPSAASDCTVQIGRHPHHTPPTSGAC